jgi:hypothetical protein
MKYSYRLVLKLFLSLSSNKYFYKHESKKPNKRRKARPSHMQPQRRRHRPHAGIKARILPTTSPQLYYSHTSPISSDSARQTALNQQSIDRLTLLTHTHHVQEPNPPLPGSCGGGRRRVLSVPLGGECRGCEEGDEEWVFIFLFIFLYFLLFPSYP